MVVKTKLLLTRSWSLSAIKKKNANEEKGQASYVRGYKYCHYQGCLSSPVFGRQPYQGPSTTIPVENTWQPAWFTVKVKLPGGPMTAQAYLCIIPISSTRSAKADDAGPIFKKVNKLTAGHIINKVAAENFLYVNIPLLTMITNELSFFF